MVNGKSEEFLRNGGSEKWLEKRTGGRLNKIKTTEAASISFRESHLFVFSCVLEMFQILQISFEPLKIMYV